MHQIRQIAELHRQGKSIRQMVKLTGIARNTVREYLRRINGCKIPSEQLPSLEDGALAAIVYSQEAPSEHCEDRLGDLQERLPAFAEQLRQRGVTRWLLWAEYHEAHPGGYRYSQFCEHLGRYLRKNEAVMHFVHQAGEQMMVDFAGDLLQWVDADTGEIHQCPVLVSVLPYSGWTYAEALRSQRQEEFIRGLSSALHHAGGVPQSIKCDNLKAAVTKANRYEPSFSEAMEQFAAHYGATAVAARVRKPRDKASVENAVSIVYKRIYAPLRHQIFHSLEELNRAVSKQLEWHNAQLFKGKDYSRQMLFEKEEKALLKPLPQNACELKHVTFGKVQKNYHVILGEDYHQYSVPFTLIGKKLKLVYTAQTVEMYDHLKRVAIHARNYKKHGYTTQSDHMPPHHRHEAARRGWNGDYFKQQALQVGEAARKVVEKILESKAFPEQTYNSCLGILRLGKQYGAQRLEAACQRAMQSPTVSFGMIHNILKNGLDKMPSLFEEPAAASTHENVRGADAYQ